MQAKGWPLLAGNTYENPVPISHTKGMAKPEAYSNADPYVMKWNGRYYCYSTGRDGVNVLVSDDLVHFTHLGFALQQPGHYSYWAPCVFYGNGIFYMYVATMPEGEEDDHFHFMRVFSSSSPEGPFVFEKQLLDIFSIDAHVVQDDNGQLYMFYSGNAATSTDAHDVGTSILVDKLLDYTTLEGRPKLVLAPSLPEEIFMRNRFGDGRDWHTVEGALYLRNRGRAAMMYSGNAFLSPTYFLGYGMAEKNGPIDALQWQKHPNGYTYRPLIAKTDKVMDTGHNSVAKAPNNVDDWVVYHGRDAALDGKTEDEWFYVRNMRIDPLLWAGPNLHTPAPSFSAQNAPEMPALRALFAAEDDLSAFSAADGTWAIKDGALAQSDRVPLATLLAKGKPLQSYVAEANLRWHKHHMGGCFGLVAAWQDEANYVLAQLHLGDKALRLLAVRGGVTAPVIKKELPANFLFDVWHKLAVRRTGSHFSVLVDDLPMLAAECAIGPGTVGLFGAYTGLDCASLEVTDYAGLGCENGAGFAGLLAAQALPQPQWQVFDDKLCVFANGESRVAFAHTPANCQLLATVRPMGGRAGICFGEGDGALCLVFDEGKGQVELLQGGKTLQTAPCQENFVGLGLKRRGKEALAIVNGACLYKTETLPGGGAALCANGKAVFCDVGLLGLV